MVALYFLKFINFFKIEYIKPDGSFNYLLVKSLDPTGVWITVWNLSDKSQFADSEWLVGQVEVYSRQIRFEAFKTDEPKGWVAIDNVLANHDTSCVILPAEAEGSTITPDTTTQQGE